jgi:hypothetical protein
MVVLRVKINVFATYSFRDHCVVLVVLRVKINVFATFVADIYLLYSLLYS